MKSKRLTLIITGTFPDTKIRRLVWIQASYFFITALWPIVDIGSFMAVTGPKTDVWLVKTIGALLIPVSLTMALYLLVRTADPRFVILLGVTSAMVFLTIDLYYVLTGVIPKIYLADAVVELGLLICWALVLAGKRNIVLHSQET
jgi:hypothetical protein